jgi:hypothetical protein
MSLSVKLKILYAVRNTQYAVRLTRNGEMREFRIQARLFVPEFIYRPAIQLLLMYRRIRYGYTFRRIPLTQGKFAIVDVDDFEDLNRFKWFAVKYSRTFYAIRNEKNSGLRRFTVKMHRQILNLPKDKSIDHINHNGLDNRKANLRIVSPQQNNFNKQKQAGNYSSKYKGVMLWKRSGKWQACITYKGKHISLGYFDDQLLAARAYDAKAKELFGQYAYLNFPV